MINLIQGKGNSAAVHDYDLFGNDSLFSSDLDSLTLMERQRKANELDKLSGLNPDDPATNGVKKNKRSGVISFLFRACSRMYDTALPSQTDKRCVTLVFCIVK